MADDYDLVLIDNPPNLHLLAAASMVASDAIVIPLQAEDFGAQGLGPVRAAISAVQAGANPEIRLAGYLVTMFDKRLGIHLAYESKLREMYGQRRLHLRLPAGQGLRRGRLDTTADKPLPAESAAAKATKAVAESFLSVLTESPRSPSGGLRDEECREPQEPAGPEHGRVYGRCNGWRRRLPAGFATPNGRYAGCTRIKDALPLSLTASSRPIAASKGV